MFPTYDTHNSLFYRRMLDRSLEILPRSPHGSADGLRNRLHSAESLRLQSGTEAGFKAQEFLVDLRESHGALSAAVQAGRGDGGAHRALDEVVHLLARVLVQTGFGKHSGDTLEAGFVAFFKTVCGI